MQQPSYQYISNLKLNNHCWNISSTKARDFLCSIIWFQSISWKRLIIKIKMNTAPVRIQNLLFLARIDIKINRKESHRSSASKTWNFFLNNYEKYNHKAIFKYVTKWIHLEFSFIFLCTHQTIKRSRMYIQSGLF